MTFNDEVMVDSASKVALRRLLPIRNAVFARDRPRDSGKPIRVHRHYPVRTGTIAVEHILLEPVA